MVIALIKLRLAESEVAVTEDDEIEDVDFEEQGFQATYARLAVAAPAPVDVVPFRTVHDATKNFVARFMVVDSALGGLLLQYLREKVPSDLKPSLSVWGIPIFLA